MLRTFDSSTSQFSIQGEMKGTSLHGLICYQFCKVIWNAQLSIFPSYTVFYLFTLKNLLLRWNLHAVKYVNLKYISRYIFIYLDTHVIITQFSNFCHQRLVSPLHINGIVQYVLLVSGFYHSKCFLLFIQLFILCNCSIVFCYMNRL